MPTKARVAAGLSLNKSKEHDIIQSFTLGYRNREDQTKLPSNCMVTGSQNVLTNTAGRISSRKGYTLDGAANTDVAPILSSYDWEMHIGDTRHLRGGFLTSAGTDGRLQFRSASGVWTNLITGLTSVSFNFADFWDTTAFQSRLLMVNGASSITEWSGGETTFGSATANTITKEGTTTWAKEGFYPTGTHTVVIAGVSYGATGGWATTTLTGVAPDPTTGSYTAGDLVHQKPETTLNSAMTDAPSSFSNDLIANLRNQIYLGSFTKQAIYVSNVDDYKNYGFTTPTRVAEEGAILTLDGIPTALVPRENAMNISAGKDQWYTTKFTLSSDLTGEKLEVQRLKTTADQAARSQGLTSKIKNNTAFVSFEPIVESLGWVDNVFGEPQLSDLSFPIINDMNSLDFTDGQVIYHKNFLYISAPKSSTVLIYNMTDPNNRYWEAPQILPVGRFSVIDGYLYGHSYLTSETYKLFTGYNDNGNFITSTAKFAFNSHGMRATSKGFNEFYVEGYISSNTTLELGLQYDLDGCARNTLYDIDGSNTQYVCIGSDDNLLGKYELGKKPLGANMATSQALPPKFRVIKTFPKVPYYEYQASFGSTGVDQQWEIIGFGPAWSPTSEGNAHIMD